MAVFERPPAPLWTQHLSPFHYRARPSSPSPSPPLYDLPINFAMVGPVRTESASHRPSPLTANPPRPPNAWILYRSDKLKDMPPPPPGAPRRAQADISKTLSTQWKQESPETRAFYERLSDIKKAEHQVLYPNYRFQPMKKAEKDRLRAKKLAERERERGERKMAKTRPRQSPAQPLPALFTTGPRATPSADPTADPAALPPRPPTPPAEHPTPRHTPPSGPSPALYPASPAAPSTPPPLAAPQPGVYQRPPSASDWHPAQEASPPENFDALWSAIADFPDLPPQEYLSFTTQYPPLGWTPADPAPATDTPFIPGSSSSSSGSPPDPLQAILTPTDDPYVFDMHNLDFSFDDFTGGREIEISADPVAPQSAFSAFDTFAATLFPEQSGPLHMGGGGGISLDPSIASLLNEDLAFLPPVVAPDEAQSKQSTAVASAAAPPAHAAPAVYAPPVGAAMSVGARRVAADWRAHVHLTPEPDAY